MKLSICRRARGVGEKGRGEGWGMVLGALGDAAGCRRSLGRGCTCVCLSSGPRKRPARGPGRGPGTSMHGSPPTCSWHLGHLRFSRCPSMTARMQRLHAQRCPHGARITTLGRVRQMQHACPSGASAGRRQGHGWAPARRGRAAAATIDGRGAGGAAAVAHPAFLSHSPPADKAYR